MKLTEENKRLGALVDELEQVLDDEQAEKEELLDKVGWSANITPSNVIIVSS